MAKENAGGLDDLSGAGSARSPVRPRRRRPTRRAERLARGSHRAERDREYTEDEPGHRWRGRETTHYREDVFLGKDYIDQLYDRDSRRVSIGLSGPHAARRWSWRCSGRPPSTVWLPARGRRRRIRIPTTPTGSTRQSGLWFPSHADLGSVLKNMAFEHTSGLNDDIKSNLTVQECINCHHWALAMEKNMNSAILGARRPLRCAPWAAVRGGVRRELQQLPQCHGQRPGHGEM